MPVTPTKRGWVSGNTPLARGEHITGAPARSASARRGSAASRAPKPAQMANEPDASASAAASAASGLTDGERRPGRSMVGSGAASGIACTADGTLMWAA